MQQHFYRKQNELNYVVLMFFQGGSRNGDMKGDDNYIIERYIRCLVF